MEFSETNTSNSNKLTHCILAGFSFGFFYKYDLTMQRPLLLKDRISLSGTYRAGTSPNFLGFELLGALGFGLGLGSGLSNLGFLAQNSLSLLDKNHF